MASENLSLFFLWCWFQVLRKQELARSRVQRFHAAHPERASEYYLRSKERHPLKRRLRSLKYRKENPEKAKQAIARWKAKNIDRVNRLRRCWKAGKLASDLNWKLRYYLSNRIRKAVKAKKSRSAGVLGLLGCSVDQLRDHLQKQFVPGMSWDNYGTWHIDHIRPCASFDLTDVGQQQICFNYRNLQPLWGSENIKKGATYHAA